MARCPDCNKFVPIEQGELEASIDLRWEPGKANGNRQPIQITGEVRLTLICGECGTELMETNQDIDAEIEFQHDNGCSQNEDFDEDSTWDNSDRDMYAKHFYGADGTITVTCPECKAEATCEVSVEEQASFFDQLY
jgi:hypothetical protein